MGGRGSGSGKGGKSSEQAQFERDSKRIEDFLNSNTQTEIELENGQMFEKSNSIRDLQHHMADVLDKDGMPTDPDTTVYIRYKDGSEAYSGWNNELVDRNDQPIKRLKRTNIETYIEDGSWGTHIYGKVNIVDYNQRYKNWGGADWRAE